MEEIFKPSDRVMEFNFIKDKYNIYIMGGRHVKIDTNFKINITNKNTGANIEILEHKYKIRDFSGVRYFYFNISQSGIYCVSCNNYDGIIVKKSMLFFRNLFQSKLDVRDIQFKIERANY